MKPLRNPLFPATTIRYQIAPQLAAAVATILSMGGPSAHAALTWNSAGPTNNWSTAAGNGNWNPGGVVWTQNESAVFDGTSGTPEAIAVSTTSTFDNITFDVSGFSITSAGAGSFVLANDLASTITVTNLADSATINETFADNSGVASSLTKSGLGTLSLIGTANNTFTGGTIISAGKLIAGHEGSLGFGPVTNNATLDLNKANVTFTGLVTSMTGNGTANVTALGTGNNTVLLNGDYSGFTGPWNIGVGAVAGAGKVQMNGADNAATTITVLPNATVYAAGGTHNATAILKGGDTGESIGQLRLDNTTTNWAGPVVIDGVMTGAGDGIIGCNTGAATISGLISEVSGPRELSKAGGATVTLTNANTYSGPTRILNGKIGVSTVNNSGVNSPLGKNATIALGNGGTGAILLYTGTGETTNRVLDLAGTTGSGNVEVAGSSGLLKFTSNLTASGAGPKVLALQGVSAAGEIAGQIVDNTGSNATTLSTAFAAAATTITLGSVQGLTTGLAISGTGIAGGTTISAINTATRVVTLSVATSGAGTVGQAITVAGVINPTGIVKNAGNNTWTLSGNNPFTGNVAVNSGDLIITNSSALGVGPKTITVSPTSNPTSLCSLVLDGTGGPIALDSSLSFTTSFDAFSTTTPASPIAGEGAIINQVGNNSIAGNFSLTSGGGGTTFLSNAGKLTVSGGISSVAGAGSARTVYFRGNGDGELSGVVSNGSFAVSVTKDAGSGTWTLSGNNTFTGNTTVSSGNLILAGTASNASARVVSGGIMTISGDYSLATGNTTVNAGTLRLDYSTNDSGKLGDSNILTLGGGTVELAGGTHGEIVSSTTLSSGTTSLITRSSGTATLNLRTVSGGGSLVLADSGIATTDNTNTNGILPWARVLVAGVPVLAKNSTDAFDGPIVPYTGFTDVTRLGVSAVPNTPAANVRIINGGTSGNITLTATPNQINFLQMGASDGAATIAPTAPTDVFSIGADTGGTIWQSSGSGSLSIGTAANDGVLTTGDVDNGTPATLAFINDSSNPLVANSTIANNGGDVVSLTTGGSGQITLNGDIISTGTITTGGSAPVTIDGNITAATNITHNSTGLMTVSGDISGAASVTAGGNLLLSGNNSFSGALTITGIGRTVTLTGNNSARPGTPTSRTVVSNGNFLRLEANPANTTGSLCTVLSAEPVGTAQPLVLNGGSTLQLRSDSSLTFGGSENIGGLNNMSTTIDVDRLTAPATGQTLTLSPLVVPFGNAVTLNVTGANGYGLSIGTIRNVTGTASAMTLNPTTGNLTIAGYENLFTGTANANNSTVTLGGTATGNVVSGIIRNQGPASVGTGSVAVVKNGTGTWTLAGANTYTGTTTINDGTLKSGNAAAFNNVGTLGMAGAGVLDLNGFGATFTNITASATTNLITDNSAGAGTTTLTVSNLATTISALVKDGPSKAVRVYQRNANTGNTVLAVANANTFSGGLVLANGTGSGTRLRISAPPVTVGSPGAIVSSPFGTGPITIGEAATDKAGILLDTLPNFTIANAIVFNTALGTDVPGIRLDTTGHTFSGTITANLSNALFANGGSARLTGKITGANGLQLNASTVSITLGNAAANNDYLGDTTLGAGSTLVLGAANQIPDGIGKGDVTANGTLNLAGFSEGINGLSGTTGTVTSTSGSPVLTVGNEDSSGVYSGATAGSLSFVKTGSGIQTLGAIGHSGDTTVAGGILSVSVASTFANSSAIRLSSSATLNLSTAGTDVVGTLFIDGVGQASGTWGRIGSGAAHETALITGPGLLNVTTSGSTPYSLWAAAKGLTPGVNDAPTADPDGDGDTNLKEYAFDGNPLSGASSGKVVGKIGLVGGSNFMTLTFPARTGAVFTNASGPDVSAAIDGVTYRIEGSDTLGGGSWTLDVTEVTGGDAATIQSGLTLPGLTPGWTYRTFRAPTTTTGNPSDFLRAGAE